jgi:hypothetical protein
MSEMPGTRGEAGDDGYQKPLGDNGFLQFVQQPRILLILLAAWEVLGFLTELFTSNALFLENHASGELSLDGVLGGGALGWESVPLAVLYLYCARDPERYSRIFWLACIEQAAAIAANLYHWLVTDDFSFESVAIPMAVAAGLGTLSFLNIFQAREGSQRMVSE